MDRKIQELAKEVGVGTLLGRRSMKFDQTFLYLTMVGFVAIISIDMSFMGEASCMMDLHRVCERTGFESFEVAVLVGTVSFLLYTFLAGLLILIVRLNLEIRCRVEKIQDCLETVVGQQEQILDVSTLKSYSNDFMSNDPLKVISETICLVII